MSKMKLAKAVASVYMQRHTPTLKDSSQTFWRIHPGPFRPQDLDKAWTSSLWVGDGKTYEGLSVTDSYQDLIDYFVGEVGVSKGRGAYFKKAHLVQLNGNIIGKGHDGEPLIVPTKVVSSVPLERTEFIEDVTDAINRSESGSSTDVYLYMPDDDAILPVEVDDPDFMEYALLGDEPEQTLMQRSLLKLKRVGRSSALKYIRAELEQMAEDLEVDNPRLLIE